VTDKYWNQEDYLFEFDDVPRYEGELVEMPIHHKVEKVRHYLIDEILGEMERCLLADADLGALLLGLAAVDYLAGFYVGKQSTGKDYQAFMKRYFPPQYREYLDSFYSQLRSGMMHNLVAANPWKPKATSFLVTTKSSSHLQTTSSGQVVFSVSHFRIDIYRAWRMHAHDMIMKPDKHNDLVQNFVRRFNKLDGVGAFMEKVPDEQ